jgi:hypothetical protein
LFVKLGIEVNFHRCDARTDLGYRCRARQYDVGPRSCECGSKRELLYRSSPTLGQRADFRNRLLET